MSYTPAILEKIGLGIFLETGMADSLDEGVFLWRWAIEHKRFGVTDHEAVFYFFQMIAWRNPDKGASWLRVKPNIIRRRCQSFYPGDKDYMTKVSEKQFRQAVMGVWNG